jgi:hypothetical protein
VSQIGTLDQGLDGTTTAKLAETLDRVSKTLAPSPDASERSRIHYMIGDLPDHFVPRPDEYEQAKRALLQGGRTVALTTALHGAGGYGKTTLANALCRDPDIQREFSDGVLRVELGKETRDAAVTARILNLIELIDPKRHRPGNTDAGTAPDLLAEALGDARILLVLDDVWREPQLRPFLRGGPNCVRLVTTRIPEVLPAAHVAVRIDEMRQDQAQAVLAGGLPGAHDPGIQHRLARLAERLGFWGQMLAIANGWLRAWTREGVTTAQAVAEFEARLDEGGLTEFDPANESERNRAVRICIEASLEDLDTATERPRLEELAVLPEDADVPISVITQLWAESGGMRPHKANDFLSRLNRLSMLQTLDRGRQTVRLHDNMLWYLRDRIAAGRRLEQAHAAMVTAIQTACGGDFTHLLSNEAYFWRHLIRHLRGAGQNQQADRLLTDYAWIKAKLHAVGPHALFETYLAEPDDSACQLVGRTIALSVRALSIDPRELPRQIFGRLGNHTFAVAMDLVASARADPDFPPPPRWPILTPPGAERLRLHGHEDWVRSAAFSPDGERIVTASSDRTARIWDARSGQQIAALHGHEAGVQSAAFSPDGARIVTASEDGTARIWNASSGETIVFLQGHERLVNSAAFSPDGARIVTASNDRTARIWNASNGETIAALHGHEGGVGSAAFSPDGARIVTASFDRTARIWDASSGETSATLQGHEDRVWSAAFSPNGARIVTASSDHTARIWDASSGEPVTTLQGILSAAFSPDGERIVTASDDRTARIWDARSGQQIACIVLDAAVTAVALSRGAIALGDALGRLGVFDICPEATDGERSRLQQ